VAAAEKEIAAFALERCCYSFRDWNDDVNAVAVPFREPREGRWLVLSCSGPASSMGEDVFRESVGPRLKALARRLGDTG
jgi:DNA-binding IclR family transcriptional regulator